MSAHQTWAEALNINDDHLQKWGMEASGESPLLVWCLEQNKINITEYLQWAQEHFQLPILDKQFFNSAFDVSVCKRLVSAGEWSSWIFPIAEWEGVTIIACVEPPAEIEDQFRYVLCDVHVLREVWNQQMAPEVTKTDMDTPQGLLGETRIFRLDLEAALQQTESSVPELVDPPPTEKKPPAPPAPAPPVQHTALPQFSAPPQPPAPPRAPSAVPPIAPTFVPAAPTPPSPTPPPSPSTVTTISLEEATHATATAIVKSPYPDASPITTIGTMPDIPTMAAPRPTSESKSAGIVENLENVFKQLKKCYQSVLVLRCDGSTATVLRTDETLKMDPTNPVRVDLAVASLFRIVHKTQLPYHGYIVDSPAHQEFFKALSVPALPHSLTALPLKVDDRLWGILVAFGDEKAQSPEALQMAERIVQGLLADATELKAS